MKKAGKSQLLRHSRPFVAAAALMLVAAGVPATATASISAASRPAVAAAVPGTNQPSCVNGQEVYDWSALGRPVAPQVPTAPASRIGVYSWGLDLTTHSPSDGNILDWGANHVTAAGAHTISVFLGFRDDYDLGLGSAPTLLSVAKGSPYAALFKDPRLSTYVLTTYSPSDQASAWADGYSCAAAENETDQMKALGVYLLTRHRAPASPRWRAKPAPPRRSCPDLKS